MQAVPSSVPPFEVYSVPLPCPPAVAISRLLLESATAVLTFSVGVAAAASARNWLMASAEGTVQEEHKETKGA